MNETSFVESADDDVNSSELVERVLNLKGVGQIHSLDGFDEAGNCQNILSPCYSLSCINFRRNPFPELVMVMMMMEQS